MLISVALSIRMSVGQKPQVGASVSKSIKTIGATFSQGHLSVLAFECVDIAIMFDCSNTSIIFDCSGIHDILILTI